MSDDLRERVAEAIVAYENARESFEDTSVDGYVDAALAEVAAWLPEQVEVVARAIMGRTATAGARHAVDALVALLRGEGPGDAPAGPGVPASVGVGSSATKGEIGAQNDSSVIRSEGE